MLRRHTDTPASNVTADAFTPTLRKQPFRPSLISVIGLAFVALVVAWLAYNLYRGPALFLQLLASGLARGCIYALVAIGYTLVYGILELINFAHGDVYMLGGMFAISFAGWFGLHGGGFGSWLVVLGLLLICMGICALINVTVELIAYRKLRGGPRLAPLITAIGVSFILETIAIASWGPQSNAFPEVLPDSPILKIGGVSIDWKAPVALLITLPVLAGLIYLVRHTRQGKAMRATAQDMDAAAIMGINVNRTISFTFLIAGALAGAGGLVSGLTGFNFKFDSGFTLGLIAFTSAVLGGIGNLSGAVLGAVMIGIIQEFNDYNIWGSPGSDWTNSLVFGILILILVFRPEGLLGERSPEGS